jgi:hypothetical protein
MSVELYCWRCDKTLPMLEENEWAIVSPLLSDAISQIQQFRVENNCSLDKALELGIFGTEALAVYQNITGNAETDINSLSHHRASIYGPPCVYCGKPLRTPSARLCAACGESRG